MEIKKPPGASRKISDDAIAALKHELETGVGFSSYGAIVEWLEKEHGQCIQYGDNPSNNSEQSEILPSKNNPSKTRRHKGLGSGSIQWKTITLHGKDYPQAWYHYEFWKDGVSLVKKCKYIPKRLLEKIEKLEADKAPVREILSVLRVKFSKNLILKKAVQIVNIG
ncbi:MAG: hypothetical protein V7K32_27185 [Nostoc sp.]|uniref:hypothetical protein n=1 Tax=Nostoc sp. TaxID=1180 RepID=UPI002FF99DB4